MDNNVSFPNIEELRKNKELYGELISCSYSSYSSGMMFNSNSSENISVSFDNGEQIIKQSVKAAFGDTIRSVYKARTDVLGAVKELAERENLAALSELKYVELYHMTDVSGSESVSLTFDDRSVGGSPFVNRNINVSALRQQDAGNIAEEYLEILKNAIRSAELISTDIHKTPGMAFMGMGMSVNRDNNSWNCKKCGNYCTKGKFCTECGTPKEENG